MAEPVAGQTPYEHAYGYANPGEPPQFEHNDPSRGIFPAHHGTAQEHPPMVFDAYEPADDQSGQQPPEKHVSTPSFGRGVSWQVPTVILLTFFLGVLVAIVHHVYYSQLDESVVGDKISQQWAIRIGTGLALLSKVLLAGSVGVAYTQRVWRSLRRKAVTVRGISGFFALKTNAWNFTIGELYRKDILAVLLGAITWLLPLVAVITPASLTTVIDMRSNTSDLSVPSVYWPNASTLFYVTGSGGIIKTSNGALRLVSQASTNTQPAPILFPYPNASYTASFYGLAAKCNTKNLTADEVSYEDSYFSSGTDLSVFMTTDSVNVTCDYYNGSYTAKFGFLNGLQNITLVSLQEANKLEPFKLSLSENPPERLGYQGLILAINNILHGSVAGVGSQATIVNTTFGQTPLVGCPEFSPNGGTTSPSWALGTQGLCRNGTLALAFEDLVQNVTYSIFNLASRGLWKDDSLVVPVTTSHTVSVFTYSAKFLWLTYALAVGFSLLGILVGLHALFKNGTSHDNTFAAFLATTRNSDLDYIAAANSLGTPPFVGDFAKTELTFGIVDGSSAASAGVEHTAFGLPATTRRLKKM